MFLIFQVILLGCSSCCLPLPRPEAGPSSYYSQSHNGNNGYGRGGNSWGSISRGGESSWGSGNRGGDNSWGARQSHSYSSSTYGGLHQPKVTAQYGLSSGETAAASAPGGSFSNHFGEASWGSSSRHRSWKEDSQMSRQHGVDRSGMDRTGMDRSSMDRSSMDRSSMERPVSSSAQFMASKTSNVARPVENTRLPEPMQTTKATTSSNLQAFIVTTSTNAPTRAPTTPVTTTTKQTTIQSSSTTVRPSTTTLPPSTTRKAAPLVPSKAAAAPPSLAADDLLSDVSKEVDLTKLLSSRRPPLAEVATNSLEPQVLPLADEAGISLRKAIVRLPVLESFPAVPELGTASSSPSTRPPRPALMAVAAVPGLPVLDGEDLI
jgi:hypothetical protein